VILAAHQVNFLPYSGFWYKVANADLFDLRFRAQFTQKGYQRRVMMRDQWCTLPLVGKPRFEPINEVLLDLPKAKETVTNNIKGRYLNAPHYKTRGNDLLEVVNGLQSPYLWEWNFALLLHVRDVLKIDTPFTFGVDTIGDKAEGVLSFMRAYPTVDTYLSGTGAKAYMGDTPIFDEAGIKLAWSRHKAITHDSVVSLLVDYDDPMEIIMMEHEEGIE
jgi:hypothetical protein